MTSVLNAALLYVEKGLPVFPCNQQKKPLVKGGFQSASTNANQIQKWWGKWPEAMIGVPTGMASGIDVLDLDCKKDKNGFATLPDWADHSHMIIRTPSGGGHSYHKAEGKIRNSTDKIGKGVDTRGEGGYVIVPPSRNGGGAYWFERCGLEALGRLRPFPANLAAKLELNDEPRKQGTRPQADPTLIAKALAAIPNADVGWEDWNRVAMATWRAAAGSDAGFAAFDRWSQKSKKYDAAETREKWSRLKRSPPTEIGAGSLFMLADAASPGWRGNVQSSVRWRECRKDGSPIPSMHNARLAITALGIEGSYDSFHNKLLIGFRSDDVQHELQSVVGEMSDHVVIRLRQVMSDHFGFDLTEQHTRDAVISLALENCFDPVCDMLTEAEAAWDGKKRLDRMAVDYFNGEDTPLNRAFVRKMMIAAAHRARVPGCKFDNILVLEGPEGWNKSSAFNVLADDENFSDESILGARNKEVQEQLRPIWFHENADLAGMKNAEVEHVKAFASRRVDIARPAYGRVVTKQSRHSIEVGTTNSGEYLQSQTGNRRFWPLKLLRPIDLDKLRKDRVQLWGEAAKYERDGESVVIDEVLWPDAVAAQEQRRAKDPWEDLIFNMEFRTWGNTTIIHIVDNEERVASSVILETVLEIPPGQQERRHAMRLAVVMKENGWERNGENKITLSDGSRVRGYFRRWRLDFSTDGLIIPAPILGRPALSINKPTSCGGSALAPQPWWELRRWSEGWS